MPKRIAAKGERRKTTNIGHHRPEAPSPALPVDPHNYVRFLLLEVRSTPLIPHGPIVAIRSGGSTRAADRLI